MLVVRSRITVDREVALWVGQALAVDRVESIAVDAAIAVEAALLDTEGFPGDPADRIVYATAGARRASLVTKDAALRAFDPALTVW